MTTEEPPEISGIKPGPTDQMPTLTPTPLPGNVIQITTPPQAPVPTGLASALGVIKTPDIFRDMSNLDEASTLLGKLADGTIKNPGRHDEGRQRCQRKGRRGARQQQRRQEE